MQCKVCGVPCSQACKGCVGVLYCSQAHQQQDWDVGHNKTCPSVIGFVLPPERYFMPEGGWHAYLTVKQYAQYAHNAVRDEEFKQRWVPSTYYIALAEKESEGLVIRWYPRKGYQETLKLIPSRDSEGEPVWELTFSAEEVYRYHPQQLLSLGLLDGPLKGSTEHWEANQLLKPPCNEQQILVDVGAPGDGLTKRGWEETSEDEQKFGIVDVQKLWEITKNTPSQEVRVSHLWFMLDRPIWSSWEGVENPTEPEKDLTPRQVIENPQLSSYHWKAIQKADLKYPILVFWPDGEQWPIDILDGLHRLSKVYLQHGRTIRVIKVTKADIAHAKPIAGPFVKGYLGPDRYIFPESLRGYLSEEQYKRFAFNTDNESKRIKAWPSNTWFIQLTPDPEILELVILEWDEDEYTRINLEKGLHQGGPGWIEISIREGVMRKYFYKPERLNDLASVKHLNLKDKRMI